VRAIAFSPDGRTLATASADGTAILWDVSRPASARRLGQLIGHEYPLLAVAFAPDGRNLATGAEDGSVIVWDVTDRAAPDRLGRALAGQAWPVRSVGFSSDGRTLATGSGDGTVVRWDVSRLNLLRSTVLARACRVVGTGLSREEWAVYVRDVPFRRTCP
jgi:WD40 repeat protein